MRTSAEMPYHIGIKMKLYPSDVQKHIIDVNDGAQRAVYNHMVACGNKIYDMKKASSFVPVYRERIEYLTTVRSSAKEIKNALPFLYENDIDAQTIANAIKNYTNALKNMRSLHTGIPAFKKKSYEQSYQTNAHYYINSRGKMTSNVRFDDSKHVLLPKLGRTRIGISPQILKGIMNRTADTRIGTITICRDSVGEYWASFSVASEEPFHAPLPKTGKQVGIDLNLIDLINDSDGNAKPNMKFYAKSQGKLKKQQHKLSRKLEKAKKDDRPFANAKGYQKQRKKVAYICRKISRQREDYLNNLSKRIIKSQDFIAAEDLKVKNILKNHKFAKSISDAGWRMFLTMLQYKADFYGKMVVLIPPQYTTQTCSVCGYVMKGEEHLTPADREWICPNCHTFHQRDVNAAKNILNKGLQAAMQTVPI